MTPIFKKLSLKDQSPIVALDAPPSFEPELASLSGVEIIRSLDATDRITFALAFVLDQQRLKTVVPELAARAEADAVLWFAYPKLTSKKYQSDLSRDEAWGILAQAGFRPNRQVAIDEDWSAVRFRRAEYVSTSSRGA